MIKSLVDSRFRCLYWLKDFIITNILTYIAICRFTTFMLTKLHTDVHTCLPKGCICCCESHMDMCPCMQAMVAITVADPGGLHWFPLFKSDKSASYLLKI